MRHPAASAIFVLLTRGRIRHNILTRSSIPTMAELLSAPLWDAHFEPLILIVACGAISSAAEPKFSERHSVARTILVRCTRLGGSSRY